MVSEKAYKALQKKYNIRIIHGKGFLPGSNLLITRVVLTILLLIVFNAQHITAQEQLPRDQYFNKKIEERSFDKKEWKSLTEGLSYEEDGAKKESSVHRKANTTGERGGGDEEDEQRIAGKMSPFWAAVFKWTIILLAVLIVAVLLYNVIGNGSIFKPKGKKIKSQSDVISIENIEANIHESDLDHHIREALQQKNFTLAIRLYYLAVIKELSLNKYIKWKRDKTNKDYLREVKSTSLFNPYRNATRIFERVFYGNAELKEQDFKVLKPGFDDLLNQIRTLGRLE